MKKLLLFVAFSIILFNSIAATRTASTGNWHTTAASNTAWGGVTVTSSADTCIIPNGVTVTVMSTGVTCGALIVQQGGTLAFTSSSSRNVIVASGGGHSGTVTIDGAVSMANSNGQFIQWNGPSFTLTSNATWAWAGTSSGTNGGIIYNGTAATTLTGAGRTIGSLTISGAGTVNISGNVNFRGQGSSYGCVVLAATSTLNIPSSSTVTLSSNTTASTDFVITSGGKINIDGILDNRAGTTGTLAGAGALTVNNGGKYIHNHTATTLQGSVATTVVWNSGSTCEISGYTTGQVPTTSFNQTFSNFNWNCTSQSGTLNISNMSGATVNGKFTVVSTNSQILRLNNNTSAFTLNVNDFEIQAGTLEFTGSGATAATKEILVSGNFLQSGGTITESGSTTTRFTFNKSGTQTFTKSAGAISNTIDFVVNSGSTIVFGTNILDGSSGSFTLSSGSGIRIGSVDGITSSGSTGNIQVGGTRTFNTGANYEYNGSSAQVTGNGLPSTVNNFTVNNSAGLSLTSGVTVNGALTLSNGALTVGSNTLAITAGISKISGTITGDAGSIVSISGTTASIPSGTFTSSSVNDLTINRASGVTLDMPSLTVGGVLSLSSGAFDVSGRSLVLNGSISGSGTLSVNNITDITIGGTGAFGTINFTSAAKNLGALTINRTISGTVTLGSDLILDNTVAGDLTLTNGTFDLGANTLTIQGAFSNNSGTGLIGGATNGNTSSLPSLVVSGSAGTFNALKFATGNTEFSNVTFNRSASIDATTGNGLRIQGALTLSGAGTQLTTNNNLTIRSTSSATGRIADLTGVTTPFSGNVTVERFIPAKSTRKWSFIASPVTQSIRNGWQSQVFITGTGTGGSICGSTSGNGSIGTDKYNSNGFDVSDFSNASLFRYNATQVSGSRWVSVANTSGNLTPGTGYRINIRGPRGASDANCANQINSGSPAAPTAVTLSVTGSYSTTPTASIFGTNSTGGTTAWTLIGNPYPSEISLQAVKAANSNISTSFYFYSAQNSATTYSIYNSATNTAADFPSGYTNGTVSDVIIASGQAFFVSTTDAADGSVSFAESHKSSTATTGNNFYSRTLTITDKLRMGLFDVTNNASVNTIFLHYLNEAGASNTAITEFDSYTFNSGTNLSSYKSGKKLVIQSRAAFTADDIVLLSVPAAVGAYRFDFSEYDQFTTAAQIVLRDKFLNIEQDVKVNNSYAFNVTADAASQGDNRFELVFKTATTLPVNFLGITAVKKNGAVEVSWNVAQETNLSGYQVERSTTGSNFNTIATVTATGANKYNTVDNSNVSGTVYYRIKTIERSGTGKYSAVVKLNLNSKGETVSVYPNPVREQVQLLIANGNNGLYSVRIITAAGKEVWQQSGLRANGQTMTIATHQLAAGNYLLALTNANGETTVAKFVKQ